MEGVYEVKDLTLIWQSNQDATLTIYTDLPNGWQIQRTITLPSTAGLRVQRTFPLDNPSLLLGTLWAPRIAPGASGYIALFQPSFIRKRRIGEYLNGTNGDIWETQPLDLGA